jgi:hypothetical protein
MVVGRDEWRGTCATSTRSSSFATWTSSPHGLHGGAEYALLACHRSSVTVGQPDRRRRSTAASPKASPARDSSPPYCVTYGQCNSTGASRDDARDAELREPATSEHLRHRHTGPSTGLGNGAHARPRSAARSRASWRPGGSQPSTLRLRAARAWKTGRLEPIGLHEARHTFASLAIAAGVNAKALSTYMAHASAAITLGSPAASALSDRARHSTTRPDRNARITHDVALTA